MHDDDEYWTGLEELVPLYSGKLVHERLDNHQKASRDPKQMF